MAVSTDVVVFSERQREDTKRQDDYRSEYERDKARIIHSAGFRRLQGKTQVMGVGEGDFHRTRLTHSIEAGQIGEGLLLALKHRYQEDEISAWLPCRALVIAACYAHDLGHPPYGHAGERALHSRMIGKGGFEGCVRQVLQMAGGHETGGEDHAASRS
jgi:dGTPase